MKKIFAVGLVILVSGVLAYSFSTFFLRASMNGPEIEIASGISRKLLGSFELLEDNGRHPGFSVDFCDIANDLIG